MFTIDQIHEASASIKSGADFPQFVQDLKSMGVTHYDTFVSDGLTKYYDANDFVLVANAKYPEMPVNDLPSSNRLKHALLIHQQGQTDYPTFCKQAAEAGVEKWTTKVGEMVVIYWDKQGQPMVVERIPNPA